MTIVTGSQIREIESNIFTERHYRVEIAMSFAGKCLSDTASTVANTKSRIATVCGYGNNGGDGFAASYFLHSKGHNVTVFYDESRSDRFSAETAYFHSLCKDAGILSSIENDFNGFDVLIDCLLGSGLKGIPKNETINIISRINKSGAYIISADIPSGLNADGPLLHDNIVDADMTVAMQYPKVNTMIFPGKKFSGEIVTAEIGFPKNSHMGISPLSILIDELSFNNLTPIFKSESVHKYNKGHLLIIGGFPGMEGSVMLAAMGALSSGAGLVTIATLKQSRSVIAGKYPEIMTAELPDSALDLKKHISELLTEKKIDGILIGPGLGRYSYASDVFEAVADIHNEGSIKHLLVDGNALYHMSVKKTVFNYANNVLLTPHTGECARLLDVPSSDVSSDLYNNAISLSRKTNSTIVLKGASTVVCNGTDIGLWPGGIPSLATAGSGDVLAGIISAFMIQKNITSFDAACAGVFIHGNCGLMSRTILTSSGIIEKIPDVISRHLNA